MAPQTRSRPSLADLEQDGPALSPADFGAIVGLRREVVTEMCQRGEIPAFSIGTEPRRRRWKIARAWAREFCTKIGIRKPAA